MSFHRKPTSELASDRPSPTEREASRLPVIVVLDDIRSTDNVGLVFRLCDCVNVEALWLAGITPYPGVSDKATRRIRKTGVGGSLDTVPWRHLEQAADEVERLREAGWRIVACEQGRGSRSWRAADYGERTVLILGHERTGVSDRLLALADEIVELPVRGITNSLNVAACASAVLYEILGRRIDAGC